MLNSKSFQGGIAKVLVSLFSLIAVSQFCIAAPHYPSSQVSTRDNRRLYARRPTPQIEDFQTKFDNSDPKVLQTQAEFISFTEDGPHLIGSNGFQGCFGIVLATKQGAIVGHYSQDPQSFATGTARIRELYEQNSAKVDGATPLLYSAVTYSTGAVISDSMRQDYVTFLKELTGKDATHHHYTEITEILEETLSEDDFLDGNFPEDLLSGALVVSNPGGGGANTEVLFVNLDMQRTSTEN
ncbi:hypothetical protein FGRMN_9872 [Fusarium graminum]|nr:hypothetical protein FGRMN_9872 [Fusarium graminum]